MTSQTSSSHPLPPPLHLTIRFSTSQPDLELDISSPQSTTVLALKHLLRTSLSSRSRLRLIYQGRILPDASALSSVLKAPPPPPRNDDPKGKGKAVEGANLTRVYVNCSIGDELTSEELDKEKEEALKPPEDVNGDDSKPTKSTRPRPRGFDRLLQSGITPSEIATLRTQFNSIHTAGFTPDAMPSPDTLRNMEDAWIDNNADGLPSGSNPLEDENAGMASVLDVLIKAMIVGFFFPLGSLAWLLRQEGIWSKRWQIFVGFGVVFSLCIGFIMELSADRP
ncbi:conserved membrane [Fusarium longipes]|uniref:Conserved membrane n=1 Tax=Fusarium longipes TaxID=694270 RepID=A0A395T150_9HYPO|nr:conserved membrane [Fusarium longipes]